MCQFRPWDLDIECSTYSHRAKFGAVKTWFKARTPYAMKQIIIRPGGSRVQVSTPVLFCFVFSRVEVLCSCVTACKKYQFEPRY